MNDHTAITRLRLPAILLCLLCGLALAGCGNAPLSAQNDKPPTSPSPTTPLPPTADVDMAHARAAFESGGELTYEEVVALRREIVGDPDEKPKSDDAGTFYAEQDAFLTRERDFAAKLAKCRLQEAVGWVAWWEQEHDKQYKDIPDKYRLAVYLYNPFDGIGKELRGYPEMFLVYLSGAEVAQLKYGQRIRFSGNLSLFERHESVFNPTYVFLDDEPSVQTPTTREIQDLRITLDRTMCLGTCPDYTLTIEPDGKVTFEGRTYTKVKGSTIGVIDAAKLTDLATEIRKFDFFSLDNSYVADLYDAPTHTLTVQMNRQSKTVKSYATSPRRLDILMGRIDQIVNTAQWIGDESMP